MNSRFALDWFKAGQNAMSRKEYNDAIHYFSRAIDGKPDLIEAYLRRSKAHLLKGDVIKSSEDRKAAFDIDPEYVIWYYQLDNHPKSDSLNYETIHSN